MNSVVFGQYYHANSWLHRLDPRCKLISMFMLMIGVFFIRRLDVLVLLLGLAFILICTSRVPIVKYLKSIKMISTVLIFTFVFQVLFNKTGNELYTFNFTLTYYNLIAGILLLVLFFVLRRLLPKLRLLQLLVAITGAFALQIYWPYGEVISPYSITVHDLSLINSGIILVRVLILVCMSSCLTLCTKPTDITLGLDKMFAPLKKIHLDTSIFTMMISIALRFIPTLINEAFRILRAQASRGVEFSQGGFIKKIRQMVSLLVPMFVIAYKKAADLALAMEARSYIPGQDRTSLYLLKYKARDYIVYIFSILLLAGMIFVRFGL